MNTKSIRGPRCKDEAVREHNRRATPIFGKLYDLARSNTEDADRLGPDARAQR
jgi:hypothetical protein